MTHRLRPLLGLLAALVLAWPLAAQPPARQSPPFNLLTSLLPYFKDKGLHEELKLTADQVKNLEAHADKWYADYMQANPNQRPSIYASHEKALAEILSADQMTRLKQISLQEMHGRLGSARVLRYPDVVEALKLNDDQKAKLTANAALTEVLTADQQAKWKDLTGKPFTGTIPPLSPLGGFGTDPPGFVP